MAYICGLATKEERIELERRGWKIEACPMDLIPDDATVLEFEDYIMVWVDNSLFSIMSGPDWPLTHTGG